MNRSILAKAIASRWPFPVVTNLRNGSRMYVDLRSVIGRTIFVRGEFDPAVFDAMSPYLRDGGRVLDIGANVGFYSIMSLDIVGSRGHVDAFEVDPRPLRCLHKTKLRFGIQQLHIHPLAVGAVEGRCYLKAEDECGCSSVSTAGSGPNVRMTSLDAWSRSQDIASIDVIKIDVEGFELNVLIGAAQVLKDFRPTLIIEADEKHQTRNDSSVSRIEEYLGQLGYTCAPVQDCHSPTILASPR